MINKIKKLKQTGFFYIFGSSVINKIIGFASTIILVRIISKSDYGVFSYAWNLFSFILIFSGLGLESGSLQLCSESFNYKHRLKTLFSYSIKIGVIFNLFLAILIYVIGCFAPIAIERAGTLLSEMFLLPIIMFLSNMAIVYLRVERFNKRYSFLSTVNTMAALLFSLTGAYLFQAKGLVAGKYLTYLSTFIIALLLFHIPFRNEGEIQREDKVDLLKISIISMLNNGLSQILYLTDVFVIGMVLTNEIDIATYKVATQIPTALSFIPASIVIYIYPYFAGNRDNKGWCLHRFKQLLVSFGTFNALISIILVVFAPQIIDMVFGNQYMDAVSPFRVLSASYFFSGTFRVIAGNLLVTQRRLLFNTFEGVFMGIINVFTDYFLISKFGIIGASYSTITIMVLSGIICTGYFLYSIKASEISDDKDRI